MKNLTKVLVILILSLICYKTNGQSFRIKGGFTLANMLMKDDDRTHSKSFSMIPGFHLGLLYDVPLNDFLSFEPGLIFTTKGFKNEDEFFDIYVKAKNNLNYLDIPLTIKASHDLGGGLKMFGAIGPYIGLGLSGKIKSTVEYEGEKESEESDIEFGSDEDEDNLRQLGMGVSFGAGVEINSILIAISYDIGLSNIAVNKDDGNTINNKVLKFSVGYIF